MKFRGNILLCATLAAALAVCVGSCAKKGGGTGTAETMPHVTIKGSVNASLQSAKSQSRVTQSTTSVAGVFEKDDKIGLFVQDQNSNAYSYANQEYTADDNAVFKPAVGVDVFYKTYYLHNIYAYSPYRSGASDPGALGVDIKTDQSTTKDYMSCDFLTTRTTDIKPQQINPDAPELPMAFDHQMTSCVVKVRNADGSAIVPTPIVRIENTQISSTINLTTPTPTITPSTAPIPKDTKNRVTMHYNAGAKVGETLLYEAIILPQNVLVGENLINVQIGDGVSLSTRNFYYKPKASDQFVVDGGFNQGKEHIFTLTINGTQLSVQGGEIAPWGTGITLSQTISGGGVVTCKMYVEVTGNAHASLAAAASAELTIDGAVYTAEAMYDQAAQKLTLSYKVPDWQENLEVLKIKNSAGVEILSVGAFTPIKIKGNPTDPTYATVLATLNADTGLVTKK